MPRRFIRRYHDKFGIVIRYGTWFPETLMAVWDDGERSQGGDLPRHVIWIDE